ncbi:MAG: hypothetical protein ACYTXC_25225 [Nostoc sp.]
MKNFEFRVTIRGFRRMKLLAVSRAIAPNIHVSATFSSPRSKMCCNGLNSLPISFVSKYSSSTAGVSTTRTAYIYVFSLPVSG